MIWGSRVAQRQWDAACRALLQRDPAIGVATADLATGGRLGHVVGWNRVMHASGERPPVYVFIGKDRGRSTPEPRRRALSRRMTSRRLGWTCTRLVGYREVSLQANARNLDALAAVDDPTKGKQALQRLTTTKKDAAGRSRPGFNPLAQDDTTLFKGPMDGEHSLRGFTNRDIRSKLTKTRWLRSCADEPKKASAAVARRFRRLHAHGLIAKIPRTRRWRVTAYGHQAMGPSLYLREHHFPNV